MLLIFSDPSQGPAETSPEAMAEWQAWGTYTQGLKDAGAFVSGEPLEAPSTATTVAVRDGERGGTDGPFAETKEGVGGVFRLGGPPPRAAPPPPARPAHNPPIPPA